MVDKKLIGSIIKTLERTVGVLENCLNTDEFSEATRRQIVETLNRSMLNLCFPERDKKEISEPDLRLQKPEQVKTEKFASVREDEIAEMPEFDDQLKSEIVEESDIKNQDRIIEEFIYADAVKNLQPEGSVTEVFKPATEPETAPETAEFDAEAIEAELKAEAERMAAEKAAKEAEELRASEAAKFADERKKLEELKIQLEEERRRLDEDWQAEKNKREQEMNAIKALLENLANEQEARKMQAPPQPAVTAQVKPDEKPLFVPPIIPPVNNSSSYSYSSGDSLRTKEPVIEKYKGTKKVFYEIFENDDQIMQGVTPISDLTRAIGINDKFQFIKELFGGDFDLYSETVKKLNDVGSLGEAISYIESRFSWEKNNDAVKRFILLLRRRYM